VLVAPPSILCHVFAVLRVGELRVQVLELSVLAGAGTEGVPVRVGLEVRDLRLGFHWMQIAFFLHFFDFR